MPQKTYQFAGGRRETMKSGNEIGYEVFSGGYAGSPTNFRDQVMCCTFAESRSARIYVQIDRRRGTEAQ